MASQMFFRRTLMSATILAGCVFAGAFMPMSKAEAAEETAQQLYTAKMLGVYKTGVFDESAAEIVDFDAKSKRLFVVNGNSKGIDILDASNPAELQKVGAIDLSKLGKGANSVAVHDGLVAVAIEAEEQDKPGVIGFFDVEGQEIAAFKVGILPDMVTFTPDGKKVLIACEGEPTDDYKIDPEGSVAIVDISEGPKKAKVVLAGFEAWNGKTPAGARIGKPGAKATEDFEPEYIAVSADSKTAWVSLQENNALAIVDVAENKIKDVVGLGFKDHRVVPFDASNKDGGINIRTWPVKGMYMPDSLYAFETQGQTFIVTGNEGDSRDYEGWSEEVRVKDLKLDAGRFPNAEWLQKKENLGRLKTTTTMGDLDGDGDHDEIYAYGARSFSIWDAQGRLVFDSADQLERLTAERLPKEFNSSDDENGSMDDRSDDKGPEPEAVTVGEVDGRKLAFIGLERISGFAIYDVTDPYAPRFMDYINSRDFTGDPKMGTAGNISPEGMRFIAAKDSPTGKALLAVAYEISGSTALFEIMPQ